MFKKIGLLALCSISLFAMHSVELNINDKDLEIGAKIDMHQFSDTTKEDSVHIGFKFLHADKSHSDLSSSADMHDYYEMNFLMKREIESTDLTIGLGVKINGTESYMSVPIGVEVGYKLPFSSSMPMHIDGAIYYAPEVLSMRDAKSFLEYRLNFEVEVIENASVILGARSLETDYVNKDIRYNSSVYLGFRFSF
ncbi:MAG: hypothetical protein GXO30_09140 [Epsilonproteobacteria bacterium]|nr:hypothetical protein [Campylobacterota bacterium]